MNGREPPLPTMLETALDALRESAEQHPDGVEKSRAKEILVEHEEFTESDAEYAIEQLQNRGLIYYVGDRVRIT